MSKYTWLFFDLDNTIFDFSSAARKALKDIFAYMQIEENEINLLHYKQVNDQAWKDLQLGRIDAKELKTLRWQNFMEIVPVEKKHHPAHLNEYYLDRISAYPIMIDGATDVLKKVSDKYHLAAVTNGLESVQKKRLQKSSFSALFKEVIISEEIGSAKPQKLFFDVAFAQCGMPDKDEVLMIGDSLHSDILGANNYSIDSCWYNHHNEINQTEIKPTFEIKAVPDLLPLLNL